MSSNDPAAWRVTWKTARFGPSGLYMDDACLARKVGGKYVSGFTQNTSLKKIVELLDEGRTADAIFLANFVSYNLEACQLTRANFNPNEARDARARWTRGSDGISSPAVEQVQYRGHFHNLVVDDLIRGLNARGANAIAHVEVSRINGVIAIPDGASLPAGWKVPYFIEVKTGDDPSFTPNQMQVYPLICIGGHATSFDPRISDIGLKPGAPLPPMDIMVVHTLGPGQPMSFINYCEVIGLRGRK